MWGIRYVKYWNAGNWMFESYWKIAIQIVLVKYVSGDVIFRF
jgi:hypothetical protein